MTGTKTLPSPPQLDRAKFRHPDVTARGEARAHVKLRGLQTLWFNTGTLCNLTCTHCYIESSPTNDRLEFLSIDEFVTFLDEAEALGEPLREIGFTGGEPFLNPAILPMLTHALGRGYRTLVLTNGMRPMRKQAEPLSALRKKFEDQLTVRVSLDHYAQSLFETERGAGTWAPTMDGLRWLSANGFQVHVAGRSLWREAEPALRAGFAKLFAAEGIGVNAHDPAELVIFPEMDGTLDIAEITTACWGLLDVDPGTVMCATSRMVVKHKGAERPSVAACTLLPSDPEFTVGNSLAEARREVSLNHPFCAEFCVLGGGSCSPPDSP